MDVIPSIMLKIDLLASCRKITSTNSVTDSPYALLRTMVEGWKKKRSEIMGRLKTIYHLHPNIACGEITSLTLEIAYSLVIHREPQLHVYHPITNNLYFYPNIWSIMSNSHLVSPLKIAIEPMITDNINYVSLIGDKSRREAHVYVSKLIIHHIWH